MLRDMSTAQAFISSHPSELSDTSFATAKSKKQKKTSKNNSILMSKFDNQIQVMKEIKQKRLFILTPYLHNELVHIKIRI